jgi:hypothetical protein
VRHHQLLLTQSRRVLEDMELEVSHQIGDALRDVEFNYGVAQTRFNGWAASQDEVNAVESIYEAGRVTLDLLLDAQRRRAIAESSFYRSLADYNRAIMRLHYRKGSLLEYNGVYLAEGPWPGKAQFDALRRARQRDASLYLDYGFTRPSVVSRGPHPQHMGTVSELPAPQPVDPQAPAAEPQPAPPTLEEIQTPPAPPLDLPAASTGQTTGIVQPVPLAQADVEAPDGDVMMTATPSSAEQPIDASLPPNPFHAAYQAPSAGNAPTVTYESQAHYTAAQPAANAPGRPIGER